MITRTTFHLQGGIDAEVKVRNISPSNRKPSAAGSGYRTENLWVTCRPPQPLCHSGYPSGFSMYYSGIIVPVYLDSQVAVMVLGGQLPKYPHKVFGGSKKEDLQQLVSWIYDLAEKYDFGIHPLWVPRSLNERSDYNSHLNEYNHYDYSLKLGVFKQLELWYGPHTIDRFATDTSTQLKRYNTQYFSPHAEGLDAFTLNWGMGDNNYVFPPPLMVGRAIQHAKQCKASITLIYMEWFSRPYMNMLFPRYKNKYLCDWKR